jgi:hypothetical protein
MHLASIDLVLIVIYAPFVLAIQGTLAPVAVLGMNVNLDWGAVMAACGLGVLYLAYRNS